MKQVTYKGLKFVPYIENERIQARIREIAAQISEEFRGQNPVFLCVLNGAFPFAADLFRGVDLNAEISFIRLKSYDGTSTSGKVKEVMGLNSDDLAGRPVIVVEDIVDTGHTIVNLVERLRQAEPSDIRIATLLFKPQSLKHDLQPDYVGFEIPSKFIIGFGLDIDGQARNLPDIWILDEKYDN